MKLNPDNFVIKRRRKLYKFAKFANAENCFELAEWKKIPIDSIEIGAGTGLFSVEFAKNYPGKRFLAIDVKADRLQKGAYKALEMKLNNVFFVRARADQLLELVGENSLSSIWITFPDPFPRDRSAGRRLTSQYFLDIYQKLLKRDGSLFLKHDNQTFFDWSAEQLEIAEWKIEEINHDLHNSKLNDEYKIKTTYEERWLKDGRTVKFVHARPSKLD